MTTHDIANSSETEININDPNEVIRAKVIDVLRTICDPEIPVNIYDLGLIYSVEILDAVASDSTLDTVQDPTDSAATATSTNKVLVKIKMTLTSPGCPVAQTFPGEVAQKVQTVEEVSNCEVELVWDPPWNMANLSEEARVMLGIF